MSVSVAATLLVATGLSLAACGGDDSSTAEGRMAMPSGSDIEVTAAWARTSPAMASMGAAYMTIMSMNDDRLVAASVDSSIADHAEVHEVVMAESSEMGSGMDHSGMDHSGMDHSGMDMGADTTMDMTSGEMVMREVDGVDIVAGEMLMLKPGGYHVMIIDLVAPLEMGQTFDVTLTFDKAGDVVVPVEVRDEAP